MMVDYDKKKDSTLVDMTLLGDEKAYEALVRRHESKVLGTAYKVTGNTFSAEDASQDAFVSAWMNLDDLREKEKFGPWVCSIAKNHARTLVTHYYSAIPDVSFHLLENAELDDAENTDISGLLSLLADDGDTQRQKLNDALASLSEKIRETLTLHYFEGLSVKEIANKLSVPTGTVKWRLCEGRNQLRKEYGVMEKTYNENEDMVARVMRQVEELKLWRLKNDKTGFEDDYKRVLAAVNSLEESSQKQHALADVLMHGYWWLPGEKSKDILAEIKDAAIKGKNEDVMQMVVANENEGMSKKERIDFALNTQIPELEKYGFVKALAYVWFWLGRDYIAENDTEKAIAAYKKTVSLLTPADVYYANALSAIYVEEKMLNEKKEAKISLNVCGEVYRYIGNKLFLWTQPGYGRGNANAGYHNHSIFWMASRCDGLLFDLDMKVGESVRTNGGKGKLTYKESGVTVTTKAGTFENCDVWLFEGAVHHVSYCETVYCKNVGIVKQTGTRGDASTVWELSSYNIAGGEGLIPFAAGNVWNYARADNDGAVCDTENRFEITYFENDTAVCSAILFSKLIGYDTNIWAGNILKLWNEYYEDTEDGKERLVNVDDTLKKAAALACTKREKLITAEMTDVLRRIFATDPVANPNFTQRSRWDFFTTRKVKKQEGRVELGYSTPSLFISWKYDMWHCRSRGFGAMYNDIYALIDETMGGVWSDEWVPGYSSDKNNSRFYKESTSVSFRVLDDEDVTTAAGEFKNCRHITFERKGLTGGMAYRGGKMEYWFAEGVGIVKFLVYFYFDASKTATWELTKYEGTGGGFFPVYDGLFRRYEPIDVFNGWNASVEYTFDGEGDDIMLIRNAVCNQDRENFEADMEYYRQQAEAEKAKKEEK